MKLFLFALTLLLSFNVMAITKITLSEKNTIVLDEEFNMFTTARVSVEAMAKSAALPANEPLYLVLYSPGGEVESGLQMIYFLNSLNRPIHTIVIFAASMGFLTTEMLSGNRYILPYGTLMAHPMKAGVSGEVGLSMNSRVSQLEQLLNFVDETISTRSGKISVEDYKKLYNDEYWCVGNSCAKYNFIDDTAIVGCDASLVGTYTKDVETIFGMLRVTFSKCPMISGPLAVARISEKGKLVPASKEAIEFINKKYDLFKTTKAK